MAILSKSEINRVYEDWEDESPTFPELLNRVLNDYDAMRVALKAWVIVMTIPYDHENSEGVRLDIAIELTKAAGIEWPE